MKRPAKPKAKAALAATIVLGSWALSAAQFFAQQRATTRAAVFTEIATERALARAGDRQRYLIDHHKGKWVYRATGAAVPGVDGEYIEKGRHAGVLYYVHGRYFLYLENPQARDWDIGTDLSGSPRPRIYDCFTGPATSLLPPGKGWYACQVSGATPVVCEVSENYECTWADGKDSIRLKVVASIDGHEN